MKFKITYFHLIMAFLPSILVFIFGARWGMDVAQFPWVVLVPLSVILSKEIPESWTRIMSGNTKWNVLIYTLLFILLLVINIKLILDF